MPEPAVNGCRRALRVCVCACVCVLENKLSRRKSILRSHTPLAWLSVGWPRTWSWRLGGCAGLVSAATGSPGELKEVSSRSALHQAPIAWIGLSK